MTWQFDDYNFETIEKEQPWVQLNIWVGSEVYMLSTACPVMLNKSI